MKRAVLFLLLLCLLPLTGQEQSSEIVKAPTGETLLRWYGKPGRSYFLQQSDPYDLLKTWYWAPIIEGGNAGDIDYEVDGTAAKAFFRLKYTDQVPGPGETLDTADFDHDGISNWGESSTLPPPTPSILIRMETPCWTAGNSHTASIPPTTAPSIPSTALTATPTKTASPTPGNKPQAPIPEIPTATRPAPPTRRSPLARRRANHRF